MWLVHMWLVHKRLGRRADGAGNERSQHDFKVLEEGRERLHVWVGGFGSVDGHLDASPELARGDPQYEPLPAAHPFDRRDALRGIETGILLIEVAALSQMFGKQLLDMRGAVQRSDQVSDPRGDLSHEN